MAFDPNGLSDVAALNRGRTLFEYGTRDPLASVLAAGYFNAAHGLLTTGDSILVSADDGEAIVRAAIVNGGAVVAVSQGGAGTANLGFAANELGTGTVERTLAEKLAETVSVKDYGAKGDGTTDDGPAISAALAAAAAKLASSVQYDVTVRIPPGSYRIATTIVLQDRVSIDMRGARLIGPITGCSPIDASHAGPTNASPADGSRDWSVFTAGACFSESCTDATAGNLSGPSRMRFFGGTITGFRWGFAAVRSWAYCTWSGTLFNDCNIGIFCYQGMQHPQLLDVITTTNVDVMLVAMATCYRSGEPTASKDNYFCDGLYYRNVGQFRPGARVNATFDTWFATNILRAATNSVSSGGSATYDFTGTALTPSGRLFYLPGRNARAAYMPVIDHCVSEGCPRGVALISAPRQGEFKNVSSEGNFSTSSVTTGTESQLVILAGPSSFSTDVTAAFVNVSDGDDAKAAIEVIEGSTVKLSKFAASDIKGPIVCRTNAGSAVSMLRHFADAAGLKSGKVTATKRGGLITRSTLVPPSPQATWGLANGSALAGVYEGASRVWESFAAGSQLRQGLWRGIISDQGAETTADLWLQGTADWEAGGDILHGRMDIYIRRLDTYETDWGTWRVMLPRRRTSGAFTLSGAHTTGATSITLGVSAANQFVKGSCFTIGGADKYGCTSDITSGSVIPLSRALIADYADAAAVALVASVSSITAFNSTTSWMTVATSSGNLRLTNVLAATTRVEFVAYFTYFGPPT